MCVVLAISVVLKQGRNNGCMCVFDTGITEVLMLVTLVMIIDGFIG